MKLHSLTYLLLCCFFSAFSQTPPIPLVNEKFDKLFLSENFDSTGTYWITVSNAENLLLVQDGEYILQRKASVSPFAAMGNFTNNLNAYRLVTSFKLDKALTDEGSIGIIFMAQLGGQGGFIFEINKVNQYRLRQITASRYNYLSGSSKEGGWVKSSAVKNPNIPNLFEVRTFDKKYDIYLNNVFLMSFSEIAYKTGDIGYIIGPSSKGKIDFLYLFTNQKGQEAASVTPENIDTKTNAPSTPENDVMALAESIIALKTQINKQNEDIEDYKQMIETLKSSENDNEDQRKQLQKTIKIQDVQIKKSQLSYDSLTKVNTELLKYKELVAGNDGGDLVINLSKNLKNEKLKSEELQKVNQQLRDSLSTYLKTNPKGKGSSTTTQTSPDSSQQADPQKKEFVLPKEN